MAPTPEVQEGLENLAQPNDFRIDQRRYSKQPRSAARVTGPALKKVQHEVMKEKYLGKNIYFVRDNGESFTANADLEKELGIKVKEQGRGGGAREGGSAGRPPDGRDGQLLGRV